MDSDGGWGPGRQSARASVREGRRTGRRKRGQRKQASEGLGRSPRRAWAAGTGPGGRTPGPGWCVRSEPESGVWERADSDCSVLGRRPAASVLPGRMRDSESGLGIQVGRGAPGRSSGKHTGRHPQDEYGDR